MQLFKRLSSLIVLLFAFTAGAQNLSNKGKEFWVGYGHHQSFEGTTPNGTSGGAQEMVLYLSAEQAATVTVTVWGTAYSQTISVPANTVVQTAPIPKTGANDARLHNPSINSEGTFTKGIRILSSVPIVAYAHIYQSTTSGATMLMPTETWGYNYTSVNPVQRYSSSSQPCFSWTYIIATNNNTRIEVIPSVPTRGGKPANVPYVVNLQRGQVHQVLGALINTQDGYEMTGTKVKSIPNSAGVCHPIAVFSGSSRTTNPAPCGAGGGDNALQQVFPTQAWGTRYLTAPFSSAPTPSSPQNNTYKILVKDPTTKVYKDGVQIPLTDLLLNTYYQFHSTQPHYITSDKPIMIAQLMTGSANCLGGNATGDPEMIYISPLEQGIKKVAFYRNILSAITVHYLTLIIPTAGVASLTIDGVGPTTITHQYPHPQLAGYTVVIKRWTASSTQTKVQSDSAFTAVTYGMGSVEAYGYNAGTMINNLDVIGALQNQPDTTVASHEFTCKNTPFKLAMYIAYKPTQMIWQLSQQPLLSPNTDYTNPAPIPVDSMVQGGRIYYKYELPGTYTFTDTGTHVIKVKAYHPEIENCDNSEIVDFYVTVKPDPKANFTFNHNGCRLDTVQFNSLDTTSNGYTLSKWNWEFPDTTTANIKNPKKLFTSDGVKNIKLSVITTDGCIGDTTKPITIYAPPTASFGTNPLSLCEGEQATFIDTSFYGGPVPIQAWYWDFGNNDTVSLTTNTPQTKTFNNYGDITVKYMVRVSELCVSDTATQVITVYAKPNLDFNFDADCLPVNGVVNFTSNSSVPDIQTLSYLWNFGDPNASPTNPNTSTDPNPSHNYTTGTFTISYQVTTNNGCTKDTTVTANFKVSPDLQWGTLAPVCGSVTGTVPVNTATVVNSVPGTGQYSGPGMSANGQFNPSVAGPGTHNIKYTYTATGGCVDSVLNTISVHPKPVADFNFDRNSICLNEQVLITDQSSVQSGSITTWNWSYGDATSDVRTNNNPFSKGYNNYGTYTVKLFVESNEGCVSDTISKNIAVRAIPVANFSVPASVCMPNGVAQFQNQSTVGDGSTMTYQWNFGDASAGSTATSPSHTYATGGSYNVQLIVTSQYGCTDDTVKVMSNFYDKPNAYFTVQPATLCQGTSNSFTDSSSAPNSTVTAWNWNFGDGTASTTKNPTKTYTNYGNFNVTLVVTNAVGCVSDPFSSPVVVFIQPVIDAGPSFTVMEGSTVTFNATANDSAMLSFMWTPGGGLSNPTVLKPTLFAAMQTQIYTLSATGVGGCTASDTMKVIVLKPVTVPNAFSPNGDGINDTWMIKNLADYPGATVEVFNRYGQQVYHSYGYNKPWDGKYNGQPLPLATYYYVIQLRNGMAPITGSITILR